MPATRVTGSGSEDLSFETSWLQLGM